tara:strand:+ start:228 stop:1196 length:969 start_codon:yes stop_codon:yes gene_type:complete
MMQQMLLGYGPSGYKIDDVFSVDTYTGNSSTQTITNDIDLSGKGGLVWIKSRTGGMLSHQLATTVGGSNNYLNTNSNGHYSNFSSTTKITSFNSNGFSLGSNSGVNGGDNYVAWTFRKASEFFDIVTWSGNGTSGRTISHNLGAVPGMIFVKCTSDNRTWRIYHTYLGNTRARPMTTSAAETNSAFWNNTTPTSSVFTLGNDNDVNATGKDYIAYLFAEDTSDIIKCGGYVGNGGFTNTITTGFQTQFLFVNRSELGFSNFQLWDTTRGMQQFSSKRLEANTTDSEFNTSSGNFYSTSTGFVANNTYNVQNRKYMYMAIAAP